MSSPPAAEKTYLFSVILILVLVPSCIFGKTGHGNRIVVEIGHTLQLVEICLVQAVYPGTELGTVGKIILAPDITVKVGVGKAQIILIGKT